MTIMVRQLLQEFDRLDAEQQRQFAAEILRRSISDAGDSLADDALVEIAEDLFLELDEHERDHESAQPG